jgi:hypothetical protein
VETRFLVRNAAGACGVSYRWDHLNGGTPSEATLADVNGESFGIDITIDASPASVPWEIPSRSACLACHTPEAGHALSFNTRQLNAPGAIMDAPGNFISLLDTAGYLTGLPGAPDDFPRHLRPDETAYSLEARVRSYLDVNCAYCHQSGGTGGSTWDGRSQLTLAGTGLINQPGIAAPLDPGDLLVIPRNVDGSILYNRTAAENGYGRMPPLATKEVDLEGAQLLADWIGQEVQLFTTYEEWRIANFGDDTSPEGEPEANPDGDVGDNTYEWLTNTDPNDGLSLWRPLIRVEGGNVALDFAGLGNRSLTAQRSPNLIDWGPWQVPGNDGVPRNPADSHTLTGPRAGEKEFFRFEIRER